MPKANISRFTGIDCQPDPNLPSSIHAMYAPKLTPVQIAIIPATEIRNGGILYNTTLNTYQGYQTFNGATAWVNFNTSVPQAAGVGVGLNGSPVILPSGTVGNVEVAANQINGFIYYETTGPNVRLRINNAWHTVPSA